MKSLLSLALFVSCFSTTSAPAANLACWHEAFGAAVSAVATPIQVKLEDNKPVAMTLTVRSFERAPFAPQGKLVYMANVAWGNDPLTTVRVTADINSNCSVTTELLK